MSNWTLRTSSAVLLSILLAAGAAADEGLHEVLDKYEEYRAGDVVAADGLTIEVGHTVLKATGSVVPLLAGEERVGLLLIGGSFTYTTTSTHEHTAVRYNAKNNGVRLRESKGSLAVEQKFRTAVVLGSGLPEPEGASIERDVPELGVHRKQFSRLAGYNPISHRFALRALSYPGRRVVYAQIDGEDQPFEYLYDEVREKSEALFVLRPPYNRVNRNRNDLYRRLISEQPIGRSPRETPTPEVVLTNVDLTLVASNGTDATLDVTETLVPELDGMRLLRFDLYDEYVFDVNEAPRRYNVRRVTDPKGRELAFHHLGGEVMVELAEPTRSREPVELRFEIDGDILYRPGSSNYWELGIEPWFPWPGESAMSYTYHSVIKVEKPFIPFGSGKTVRREEEGDYNVLETRIDKPVSWVAVLAGKYHFTEETRDGRTVRVASFMSRNDDAARSLTSIAFGAMDYYPFFLGPFPFDELTIVEKNELGYGQAPAGIVFITREAFQPKFAENNEYVKGVNMRFAHEIAHQYWGHVVKMASFEDQWIEESFANYSAALFMKAAGRQHDYNRFMAIWKAEASDAARIATIPMANRLSNPGDRYAQFVTRQGLLYAKGALLLAALHKELGDDTFLTFLKSYQASFRWKRGSTRDAIDLLGYITKKDWAPFFEKYYYGMEVPR